MGDIACVCVYDEILQNGNNIGIVIYPINSS